MKSIEVKKSVRGSFPTHHRDGSRSRPTEHLFLCCDRKQVLLSDAPSLVPSDAPSTVPSDAPSSVPSDVPSDMPSALSSEGLFVEKDVKDRKPVSLGDEPYKKWDARPGSFSYKILCKFVSLLAGA
jgi:hypothetical protein